MYPKNFGGSFKTQLKRDLLFNSNYEVGLVEFQYVDNSWAEIDEQESHIKITGYANHIEYIRNSDYYMKHEDIIRIFNAATVRNFRNAQNHESISSMEFTIGTANLTILQDVKRLKVDIENTFIDDFITKIGEKIIQYIKDSVNTEELKNTSISPTVTIDEELGTWELKIPSIDFKEGDMFIDILITFPNKLFYYHDLFFDNTTVVIRTYEETRITGLYGAPFFSKKQIEKLQTAKNIIDRYKDAVFTKTVKVSHDKVYDSAKTLAEETVEAIRKAVPTTSLKEFTVTCNKEKSPLGKFLQ